MRKGKKGPWERGCTKILNFISFLTDKGLLDCETEADFQAQLVSLKDVWDEREKAHLPAGKQPSFHKYISEKVTAVHVLRKCLNCGSLILVIWVSGNKYINSIYQIYSETAETLPYLL